MLNQYANLNDLRSLYVESMMWWDKRQERASGQELVKSTRSFLDDWLNCMEELYFKQINKRRQDADMQTEFDHAMTRLKSNRSDARVSDFSLAVWGYFYDLRKLLDLANESVAVRIETCRRHEMLNVLRGRQVTNVQLTDSFTILRSVVHKLDRSNIESMIGNIELGMHAMNQRSFSIEKVGLLRVLHAMFEAWQKEEGKEQGVSAKLLTATLPIDRHIVLSEEKTPVRVTWHMSGTETVFDGFYSLEIESPGQSPVEFAPDDHHPTLSARSAALSNKRISAYITSTGAFAHLRDEATTARMHLKVQHPINGKVDTLLDQYYTIDLMYPDPHSGSISSRPYALVHKNTAWVLWRILWTNLKIIHVVGSKEVTAPHTALRNAIEVLWRKWLAPTDYQIFTVDDFLIAHAAVATGSKLVAVISDHRLEESTLNGILRRWSSESSDSCLIIVESTPRGDTFEELVRERMEQRYESISIEVIDLERDAEDIDGRSNCSELVDTALLDVMIDDEARELMLDCLEPFRDWSLRIAILSRVADVLRGRLPYVDCARFRMVWQGLINDGVIGDALLETRDEKLSIVLVSLWELFSKTNVAQSPGSIMNEVALLLEGNRELSPHQTLTPEEMENTLEQLCAMQWCEKDGPFLYRPNSSLQKEHIDSLRSFSFDRDINGHN